MKASVLVTGSEGLVGSRFIEISSYKTDLHTPKLVEFDMTDKSQVNAIFKSYNFSVVINFAAYTDVKGAEDEREDKKGLCWQVNVEGVRNLAEAVKLKEGKTHFIQISTDMVFPGDKKDKGPYEEKHKLLNDLNRLTWYGYTKGEGERVVRQTLGDSATILRLIYPVRAKFDEKMDYLRKPLSLFDQGKLYPMFSDQQVSVAFIDDIASALDVIIDKKLYGTYHVSSEDTASPFELVSYMLEKTRGVKDTVKPSKLDDFVKNTKTPSFRYPKYGGLRVWETEKALDLKFGTWKEIVDKLVKQGLGK